MAVPAEVEPSRVRRISTSQPAAAQPAANPAPPATETRREPRSRHWKWAFPVGIGLAGLASAAAVLLRGCWHRNMSWPVRLSEEHGDFSYQTCNDCGIMRLFDERSFRGYGPYGYDLHALVAHERLLRQQRVQRAAKPAPAKRAEH